MAEVYVVGSSWGGGDRKCYADEFIKHNKVFWGAEERSNSIPVKNGSCIIVKKGKDIIKVGIAKSCEKEGTISDIGFQADEVDQYSLGMDDAVRYVEIGEWIKEDKYPKELRDVVANPGYVRQSVTVIKDREYKQVVLDYVDKYLADKKQKILLNNLIALLKSNHNLVLTGAPGTGKTHLAEEIAQEMIKGKEDNKKFVQFHPSYDYTDFVEGIRPNGDVNGFERKDGVFKAFCQKAWKNLSDSKKEKSELTEENIIVKFVTIFVNCLNEEIDENGKFEIKGLKRPAAPIVACNNMPDKNKIKIMVKTKNAEPSVEISYDEIIKGYQLFQTGDIETLSYDDFNKKLGRTNHHSYVYGFLNAFYDRYKSEIEKEIAESNVTVPEKENFVFIIDEINRGDINKILGELFYAIDPGYRYDGSKKIEKVQTQYQNMIDDGDPFKDGFFVPENVYIIGTMNDIDRSVESMDFAIRRRFAWYEITPTDRQYSILSSSKITENRIDDVIHKMDAMNGEIKKLLGAEFQIGASYFTKLPDYDYSYDKLWDNHLKGLIGEYLRGRRDSEKEEVLNEIKTAYNPGKAATDQKQDSPEE